MTSPEDLQATYCATLVDEWVRQGLTHAVVCPGSRSTPLALALASRAEIECSVFHDERAAGFAALGVGIATGRPAVVLTTSGTAAVELHPAVVESHYSAVPMLVVTADRPPELRDTWAAQTIDQRELYGRSVRWFCEPGPASDEHRDSWRLLARDAYARTIGRVPGTVHLNLAFTEPLLGTADTLPAPVHNGGEMAPSADAGPSFGLLDEQLARIAGLTQGRRVLVVAGTRTLGPGGEPHQILDVAAQMGWPVIADHLSGLRDGGEEVIYAADAILRLPDAAVALRPEVIIRCGGLLTSRVLLEWMASSGAAQIGIDRLGRIPDPTSSVGESFAVDPTVVFEQLAATPGNGPSPPGWQQQWQRAQSVAAAEIDEHRPREAEVVAVLADALAGTRADQRAALFVSSSMPIRDLEWYVPGHPELSVMANRGANGIDGVVSTALGVALCGRPTAVLVGDVAMVHDTNALVAASQRAIDLLVVVIDNDGGGIFSMLPQAVTLAPERFEQLFGTPHGTDIAALARAHGVYCDTVSAEEEQADALRAAVARWAERGGVQMVVVASDRAANQRAHALLHQRVADALASTLGDGR